jgi:hypothetical protein
MLHHIVWSDDVKHFEWGECVYVNVTWNGLKWWCETFWVGECVYVNVAWHSLKRGCEILGAGWMCLCKCYMT